MKKILQKALLSVLILIVVFAFVACGDDDKTPSNSGENTECNHIFGEWTIEKEVTCTENGSKKRVCSLCKKEETETVQAVGHNFTKENAYDKYLKSTANCTAKAVYYKSCSVCGAKGEETFEYGDFGQHKFTADASTKYRKSDATCTHKAVYYKSCSVCGEQGEETFEYGDLKSHTFTKEDTNVKYLLSPADCLRKAVYYKSCSVCGEQGEETFEYGDLKSHTFTKEDADVQYLQSPADCLHKAVYYKSCSVCGEQGTETFEYGELGQHNFTNWDTDVKYRKSEATCTHRAVYYKSCSVCGEQGTETFEYGACKEHSFNAQNICIVCGNRKGTDGLEYTQNADGNSYTVTGLGTVTDTDIAIPVVYANCPVTGIGNDAFRGSQLTSITMPNSVTNIGHSAFYGCKKLTSITIPDSVTSIGSVAFYNTAWYNAQPHGVIYAGKVLYKFTGTMPANTNIVIEDGTKGIAGGAFYYCSWLTSITIPNSVTSIGSNAFWYCTKLTRIVFGGTCDEWQAIEKADEWNSTTGKYTVYCTDGTVAKDGTVSKQ